MGLCTAIIMNPWETLEELVNRLVSTGTIRKGGLSSLLLFALAVLVRFCCAIANSASICSVDWALGVELEPPLAWYFAHGLANFCSGLPLGSR